MYEIACMDALEWMATLPDGVADAIICDLPYGVTNCNWDSVIPLEPMWKAVGRILKPSGVFVTTASQPFTSALIMSNLDWFKYCWVWKKSLGSRHLDAKRRPLLFHEDVAVFSRGAHVYNPQMWRGARNHGQKKVGVQSGTHVHGRHVSVMADTSGEKYPRSVLEFDSDALTGRLHPTQKPVSLYSYLIRTYTNPGDTVVDFCAGSFTTGVAAIKEGRHFLGNDKDTGYYQIGAKRLADAAAQPSLFAEAL